MASSEAEPASFRDPDSAVFHVGGRILRGLSARGAADWAAATSKPFVDRLVEEGKLVRSERYDGPAPASPRGEPWAAVLEHERVPVVTYPFEWPFAMLRDAATLQLDVLLAALADGISLKDGSAYNVQWIGTRPLFIDVGSFEPANGPWPGYRQFCRLFLYPLLVQAHLGIAYQPYLRGDVDGLLPGDLRGMFGGRRRFKRGVFRHVYLHSVAERRVKASTEDVKRGLGGAGFGVELAKATAGKTRTLVQRLEVKRRGSTAWSDYRDTCTYGPDDAAAKRRFVEAALSDRVRALVLDLGANDGEYARLAAPHAVTVIAVDHDEAVVDALYRDLRDGGPANVVPLVMNLADPSPGLGWRNRERAPFAERVRPDAVLALALVHHLAIGLNVPLAEVVDWLAGFGGRAVVEFVDRDDPQAKRLLANKPAGLFDDYRLEAFEQLLGDRLAVRRRETLPCGTRTLYLAEPR